MLRLVRRAMPLGLLVVVLSQTSALAATVNVSQTNFVFTPKLANVQQGSSVVWTNATTSTNHTSTSDSTMPIVWDSGSMAPGATFTLPFTMAGKFTYHCSFHQALGMVGTISVPLKAQPPSGPVGTMFKIIVSTANATGNLVFDIQKKVPGGQFQNWMLGVTTKSVTFDSTGLAAGTYQFRSLVRDTVTGNKSQFSNAKSVMVT